MLHFLTPSRLRLKAGNRWLIDHRNQDLRFPMMHQEPEWPLSNLSRIGFYNIVTAMFAVAEVPGKNEMGSDLLPRNSYR